MSRRKSSALLIVIIVAATASLVARRLQPSDRAVTVTANEAARRVDIAIGGRPVTSYIWPERLKKPVLYPVRSASGTLVTRGWPFDPRPGERVDHPHQVGLWFDYGNVNGVDFWNNSEALKPEESAKMGVVVHRKVVEARGGATSGRLVADMDWIGPGNAVLLHERAEFTFSGDAEKRVIDRTTTLAAADQRVVFNDNKEGLFGMRVARQLEQPSTTPEVFTDASGKETKVPVLDNTGVTGLYASSDGLKGDDVWGKRARWTILTGRIGDEPLTLAMRDHPRNPGFPTYWHARGYGLFAANPLGPSLFTDGRQPAMNLTLEPHRSTTFRYRVLIVQGTATSERMNREFEQFSSTQTSRR